MIRVLSIYSKSPEDDEKIENAIPALKRIQEFTEKSEQAEEKINANFFRMESKFGKCLSIAALVFYVILYRLPFELFTKPGREIWDEGYTSKYLAELIVKAESRKGEDVETKSERLKLEKKKQEYGITN